MSPGRSCVHLKPDECRAIGVAVASAACRDATVQTMIVTHLLDANDKDLAELRRAVARRDWPDVQHCLHRIKGSAALARCTSLLAAGKSLESAAGQGNAAVVNTLFPRYVAILKEFSDTLSALRPGRCHRPGDPAANAPASGNLT